MDYKIDAKNKILGRVATEVAVLLRGKNSPAYEPTNRDMKNKVIVYNVGRVRVTGKKTKQKIYYRHSGYVGGLKEEKYELVFEKDPFRVMKEAVMGMLPKNKLRSKMIRNLVLYKEEIK